LQSEKSSPPKARLSLWQLMQLRARGGEPQERGREEDDLGGCTESHLVELALWPH
jgi:hypothetical protein